VSIDIWIVAGIGFTQVALTWYGVHVSVVDKRLRNAVIIGLIGAAGVALTVWGAVRSGTAQAALQTQLDTIQHNTEKPQPPPVVNVNPQVNIPPSPVAKESARLAMTTFESSHHLAINGVPTGNTTLFDPGSRIEINAYFANSGTADADHAIGFGVAYITQDATDATEKKIIADYKGRLQKAVFDSAGVIPADGKTEFWFTSRSDQAITVDDMNKLNLGQQFLYYVASLTWTYPAGSHYMHICRRFQPPGTLTGGPVIWQFCQEYADHR
jgi:hypothetical protein